MNNQRKKGVLLVQLGTPDAPSAPEVRKYLTEFLIIIIYIRVVIN